MIRHYDSLDFGYVCERERIFSPKVIRSIGECAAAGKSKAQKLHAQIMENYIEQRDHKVESVGDLNVNANVTGDLKVRIERGIITSKEDLEKLKELGAIVGKPGTPEAPASADSDDVATQAAKEFIRNSPVVINNLDTMVFFK